MQAVFPRRFGMKNGINKEPNQADDQNKCCDERNNCFFHSLSFLHQINNQQNSSQHTRHRCSNQKHLGKITSPRPLPCGSGKRHAKQNSITQKEQHAQYIRNNPKPFTHFIFLVFICIFAATEQNYKYRIHLFRYFSPIATRMVFILLPR